MTRIPHSFREPALLELALTHSSLGEDFDNERLEFLGDAALDLIVAEELFLRHATAAEGDLTELKANIVSRKALAEAAQELGLDKLARLGAGLQSRALPRSVLANIYEAVLGAVYLDAGLEGARAFARSTLKRALEAERVAAGANNPKQRFQHICQRDFGTLPSYPVLESRGEAHARAFLVAAQIDEQRFPSAWGRTRKEAETWAAYEALLVLSASPSA
jgi:ribonuclease III